MRTIGSAIMAATMIVTSAFAATDSGPLAAGKPAGVKNAQAEDTTLWWILGAGLVVGGIALVASGSSSNNNAGTSGSTSTTSTTSTTATTATSTSTAP